MNGRAGILPAWEGRLTEVERNLLALYVAGLPGSQRRLAICAAAVALLVFAAANVHLVAVAFRSQPECAAISPDRHNC